MGSQDLPKAQRGPNRKVQLREPVTGVIELGYDHGDIHEVRSGKGCEIETVIFEGTVCTNFRGESTVAKRSPGIQLLDPPNIPLLALSKGVEVRDRPRSGGGRTQPPIKYEIAMPAEGMRGFMAQYMYTMVKETVVRGTGPERSERYGAVHTTC